MRARSSGHKVARVLIALVFVVEIGALSKTSRIRRNADPILGARIMRSLGRRLARWSLVFAVEAAAPRARRNADLHFGRGYCAQAPPRDCALVQ